MTNGWTGGQYSVVRAIVGAWFVVWFAVAAVDAAPSARSAFALAGAAAAVFFVIGAWDRLAALAMIAGFLLVTRPAGWNLAVPVMRSCAPLIVHLLLPPAPYGSFAARGRLDPRGGWRFPPAVYLFVWVVVAIAYASQGHVTFTAGAAERAKTLAAAGILVALVALVPPARKWVWLILVALAIAWLADGGSPRTAAGVLLLQLLAFDPAWIPAKRPGTTDVIFFDGTCGMCHRGVRFSVAEDRTSSAFLFAPIGGARFAADLGGAPGLPDSVVVRTAAGETLMRSAALIHVFGRFGGLWRVLAAVAGALPRRVRDGAYDFVASIRYRLFGRAAQACPLLPPELVSRFVP